MSTHRHLSRDLLKYADEGAVIRTEDGLEAVYAPQFPRDPNPWLDSNGHRRRASVCQAVTWDGAPWAEARLIVERTGHETGQDPEADAPTGAPCT